jgi:hypothetical protein
MFAQNHWNVVRIHNLSVSRFVENEEEAAGDAGLDQSIQAFEAPRTSDGVLTKANEKRKMAKRDKSAKQTVSINNFIATPCSTRSSFGGAKIKKYVIKKQQKQLNNKKPEVDQEKSLSTSAKQRRLKSQNPQADSDDEPLLKLCNKVQPVANEQPAESNICKCCNHKYADINDPKKHEEWIQCSSCHIWLHETCAEQYGVFDDYDFTCKNCN